jgi:hypothetical protein
VVVARARNIGHGHRLARAIVKMLRPHALRHGKSSGRPRFGQAHKQQESPDEANPGRNRSSYRAIAQARLVRRRRCAVPTSLAADGLARNSA